jgi:hypothetical protein
MHFKTELEKAAYSLAMAGLQSERYIGDVDYKDSVDAVLFILMPDLKHPQDARRTVFTDVAEDR